MHKYSIILVCYRIPLNNYAKLSNNPIDYNELPCFPLITGATIEYLFHTEHRQKLQMLHEKN